MARILLAGADGELHTKAHHQVACEGRIRHQTPDPWFTAYTALVNNTNDDPLEAQLFMEEPVD